MYNDAMFKCLHAATGEEIIILHPRWRGKLAQLRALDQADQLICPGCQQAVRVKAGQRRRSHFAHKHLAACSLANESPEILSARALLYEWLLPQFGLGLTVEYPLPDSTLPRTVDVWVATPSASFAYWIIEKGIKLEPRATIKASFAEQGIPVNYLFLAGMLNEEKKRLDSLLLSPTERTFLLPTAFDNPDSSPPGRSLHYLELEGETLITFRDLQLFHRPNWFAGRKKTAPLRELFASSQTGQWIYPGEMEVMRARTARKQKLEQKRAQFQQREDEWANRLRQRDNRWSALEPTPTPPLRCDTCGRITSDYSYSYALTTGERVCRCRDCLS